MNRITLAAAVAVPLALAGAAVGQPLHDAPKVGWVSAGTEARDIWLKAFKKDMRALGWVDGLTVVIEPRWARRAPDRIPDLIRELAARDVDVIVTPGTALRGARGVPVDTPIVFAFSGDPVVAGLVDSLARPGGRFTGVSFMSYDILRRFDRERVQWMRAQVPAGARPAAPYVRIDRAARLAQVVQPFER